MTKEEIKECFENGDLRIDIGGCSAAEVKQMEPLISFLWDSAYSDDFIFPENTFIHNQRKKISYKYHMNLSEVLNIINPSIEISEASFKNLFV